MFPGWGFEYDDSNYAYPPDRAIKNGEKMADVKIFETGLFWNSLRSQS